MRGDLQRGPMSTGRGMFDDLAQQGGHDIGQILEGFGNVAARP
jgi:hypothetical protein